MAEDVQYCWILIAHIEVDALGMDRPSRDQRAFEHRVRLALEIEAVLEGAGLALVAVDGHQSGTRIGPHDLPLAPGGEPGAAQASQPSIGKFGDDRIHVTRAGTAALEDGVAARRPILRQIL